MNVADGNDSHLELAHVLFIDIVGYSKQLTNEQSALVKKLNELVQQTEECRAAEAAGKLIRIPTGDGMALAFFTSPDAPVRCAIELAKADHADPKLALRMGIHTGPVDHVSDVNERSNVAGAGINMAQRVMDCGDAGHILLSKRTADDLGQYGRWQPDLHDLGEVEVKHGVRIGVVNLYNSEVGNPKAPKKLKIAQQHRARTRWGAIVVALALLSAIIAAFVIVSKKSATSTLAVSEKSIAVLPFENLSDDKSNAYFADGIQDEILTKLASIADLKVISRTSTAKYKSKPEDLKTVSQQLGVANVVEGTVQRAADKVRVNVQLIDARADTHLWAKSYDRDIRDVFAIESEVSQEIADALQAKLSPNEANTLASAPTKDPEAYDSFLKGEYEEREAEGSLKAEPFDRAAVFYQQALDRDPNFALAAARLAGSRIFRHWFVTRLTAAELTEVKNTVDRALALAPNLAEAHIAMGQFHQYGKGRYDDALKEFKRALELQPNNVNALQACAYIHRRQSKWELSLSELAKCEERNPRDASLPANIGASYMYLRMWEDTKRAGSRALTLDPHNLAGLRDVFVSYLFGKGDIDAAKRTLAGSPVDKRMFAFGAIGNSGLEFYLHVIERDFAAALKTCETETGNPDEDRGRVAARVAVHVLAGDAKGAHDDIEKARGLLETRLRDRPNDELAMMQLSWVDLALKRNVEALRLAHQASESLSVEKDALAGPHALTLLAEIQARAGEPAEAVETVRRLLSIPAGNLISLQQLKIDPVWDPIRNDPGFQQLLAGKELVGPNK